MVGTQTARWSLFAVGLLTWIGLVLQFYLSLQLYLANGRSVLGAIFFFFSFFTILTNSLIAFETILTLITPKSWAGAFFSSPAVRTGTAIYIAVVGIVYSLVLRELWNPEGAQKLADLVLHDLVPILYVAWWFFFVPKNGLRWKHAVWWLAYPFAYLVYTMVRGRIVGTYPYPFLDVSALGYWRVLANAMVLLVIFLGLGASIIVISRRRAHLRNASSN
jgi:hypothetical protein